MSTTHDDGIFFPARDPHAAYGSEQWEKDNQREIAARPRVLPLNQRAHFTSTELAEISRHVAAGMNRTAAVKLVVDSRQ